VLFSVAVTAAKEKISRDPKTGKGLVISVLVKASLIVLSRNGWLLLFCRKLHVNVQLIKSSNICM